jgi:chemotaxis protein MotA
MIVIFGALVVTCSVIGGFLIAGGNILALMQISEFLIIVGAAGGALIIMSPKEVIIDIFKESLATLKGTPYKRKDYEDLFKALYELFILGRRNGMTAVEEHIMDPYTSPLFGKYPTFLANKTAVELLTGGLRPIVDGKVKPDQLKMLMEIELDMMDEEHHKPVNVLTKTADAMPGFGIVAAVLGIVITMASIAGPIDEIGHHVAAALVGTFLGILISYGYLNPLAVNMEFLGAAKMTYCRCIATAVVGFANGMAPIMAIEMARRSLSEHLRPSAEELEVMLKQVVTGDKSASVNA